MRFRKIKIGKEVVEVTHEIKNQSGNYDVYTLVSKDIPDPAFSRVMREMGSHIVDICEFDAKEKNHIEGRSVSFDYGGEREDMGVVLTGIKKLKHSNGVLVLNTPHKVEKPDGVEMSAKQVLTQECVDDLKQLKELAHKFIKGHRAQTDMFTSDPDGKATDKPDNKKKGAKKNEGKKK